MRKGFTDSELTQPVVGARRREAVPDATDATEWPDVMAFICTASPEAALAVFSQRGKAGFCGAMPFSRNGGNLRLTD